MLNYMELVIRVLFKLNRDNSVCLSLSLIVPGYIIMHVNGSLAFCRRIYCIAAGSRKIQSVSVFWAIDSSSFQYYYSHPRWLPFVAWYLSSLSRLLHICWLAVVLVMWTWGAIGRNEGRAQTVFTLNPLLPSKRLLLQKRDSLPHSLSHSVALFNNQFKFKWQVKESWVISATVSQSIELIFVELYSIVYNLRGNLPNLVDFLWVPPRHLFFTLSTLSACCLSSFF